VASPPADVSASVSAGIPQAGISTIVVPPRKQAKNGLSQFLAANPAQPQPKKAVPLPERLVIYSSDTPDQEDFIAMVKVHKVVPACAHQLVYYIFNMMFLV
jgi:hypothetical protein